MIRHRIFALAILSLALALPALAQDHDMSPEEQQKAWAEYMALTQPSEHHKHLDVFVGEWKTTMKVWMGGPGSEPMVSHGTSTKEWVMGGRYLQETSTGTMMGQPMTGMGLTGYDNIRNLYTQFWCDNMGTQPWIARGGRHPETGRISLFGEMDESMINVYGRTVQSVYEVQSNDRHSFAMIDLHAGDDDKVFEVIYERVK